MPVPAGLLKRLLDLQCSSQSVQGTQLCGVDLPGAGDEVCRSHGAKGSGDDRAWHHWWVQLQRLASCK